MTRSFRDVRGFSMVEMMTVLLIFGLVMAAAVPNIGHYLRRDRVRTSARDFRSACMVAQKRAMATRVQHRVVYNPAGGTYHVERRDAGVWNFASTDSTRLEGGVAMRGGTDDNPNHHIMTFESLGTVSMDDVPATVTFSNAAGDSAVLRLVRTGRMTLRHN